jgi:cyclic pyranopterin phosphate synthase
MTLHENIKNTLKKLFVSESNYIRAILRILYYFLKYRFKYLLKYRTLDLFIIVGLQTINVCNRKCAYCPNSLFPPKEKKLLDIKIFEKVIDDLAKIDYNGIVAPYLYGEPLLDERLPELISYASKKLPKASLFVFTNGDYLTQELCLRLIESGVKEFIVTQHENKPPQKFFEWYPSAPFSIKRKIFIKKLDEHSPLLSTRGGLVKIKKSLFESFNNCLKTCPWPKIILSVNINGDVLLCCNDFFGQYIFGNVQNKSVMEIWNDEKYKKYRDEIDHGKFSLKICKQCLKYEKNN